MYDFDKVIDRRGTYSSKWDGTKAVFGRDDILPLWIADMDFEIAPEITEAIVERTKHGVYGYSIKPDSLYDSIINWASKRHGFHIKKDWIVFTPGVVPALSLAVLAYTNIGDKVMIQTPVYPPFYKVISGNDREIVENPLKFEGGKYKIDFDDLLSKIDDKVKLFILCSPHNPIGRVWSEEELTRLADICIKNNIILVSDEIHADFAFKNHKHLPIANLSEEIKLQSLTCMAPSKTFNVPGFYTSYVIIPNDKIRNRFVKLVETLAVDKVNTFGGIALEAAYTKGERWLNEMLDYIEGNADFAVEFINKNLKGVKTFKPDGTYLMWLDFSEVDLTHDQLNALLINEAKVGLNNGLTFGTQGNKHVRLNIGCSREILKEALTRIAEVLEK